MIIERKKVRTKAKPAERMTFQLSGTTSLILRRNTVGDVMHEWFPVKPAARWPAERRSIIPTYIRALNEWQTRYGRTGAMIDGLNLGNA